MLEIKKILVPTDFSSAAWRAIRYGISICKLSQSKLTLMHVHSNQDGIENDELSRFCSYLEGRMRNLADDLKKTYEVEIECLYKCGLVSDEIISTINGYGIDMVIMGTNGSNMSYELGSTAQTIIRNSEKPVLTIPPTFNYRSIDTNGLSYSVSN